MLPSIFPITILLKKYFYIISEGFNKTFLEEWCCKRYIYIIHVHMCTYVLHIQHIHIYHIHTYIYTCMWKLKHRHTCTFLPFETIFSLLDLTFPLMSLFGILLDSPIIITKCISLCTYLLIWLLWGVVMLFIQADCWEAKHYWNNRELKYKETIMSSNKIPQAGCWILTSIFLHLLRWLYDF